MSDIIPSSKELSENGTNAVFGIAGGVLLLGLGFLIRPLAFVAGIIGAAFALFGVIALFSKSKSDKNGGLISIALGVLLMLASRKSGLISGIAGTVLPIGAFASFGYGIWNGIKFLLGLKKRS
ncbi:hypothetical protein FACS1894190_05240 [Spirochaetia bacterium]|nr:hypothetical protein FACS1894190_05240 [Spirochaetia bacterium]